MPLTLIDTDETGRGREMKNAMKINAMKNRNKTSSVEHDLNKLFTRCLGYRHIVLYIINKTRCMLTS